MIETSGTKLKDEQPSTTKTILIVEDDVDVGFSLAQILKDETPYRVLLATDGFQALKMVYTLTPHLILLDYQLPKMNGLEVARRMRATEGLEKTPIILMSAYLSKQAVEDEDLMFVPKPFELDAFLQQVQQILV